MMKKIKICGVKDPKDISVCNKLGIDFIGFNFADVSPRKIKPSYATVSYTHLTLPTNREV